MGLCERRRLDPVRAGNDMGGAQAGDGYVDRPQRRNGLVAELLRLRRGVRCSNFDILLLGPFLTFCPAIYHPTRVVWYAPLTVSYLLQAIKPLQSDGGTD